MGMKKVEGIHSLGYGVDIRNIDQKEQTTPTPTWMNTSASRQDIEFARQQLTLDKQQWHNMKAHRRNSSNGNTKSLFHGQRSSEKLMHEDLGSDVKSQFQKDFV
jgi:hypothetical protein